MAKVAECGVMDGVLSFASHKQDNILSREWLTHLNIPDRIRGETLWITDYSDRKHYQGKRGFSVDGFHHEI